ncbi:MAG: sodium:solute symporter family protein [Gemmatimonadota bacterium]|nr:MAG: sodium:solute symporter family protein [Gemmatimonadota bacterium]
MQLFGLHLIDAVLIAVYVLVIIWIGHRIGRVRQDTEGFYLAGRKLGVFYQFFLNFGHSTDSNQAAGVSREVYRQGLGGMWIQYLVLFLTPFYWFTTMLYRRSRLVTVGDLLTERFDSKFLGGAFAAFTLVMALIGGGASYMVAGKTMMALTPKTEVEYTTEEAASVAAFREFRDLQARVGAGLSETEQDRYEELQDRFERGELRGLISHTNPLLFYIAYAIVIATYTMLGGFAAAAVTDAIQGTLIVIFSFMLIPIGLGQLGGFEGLHAQVPDYMFSLFGSAATSDYAWYTILAMVLANLVSIIAAAPMMPTAGSAKNEMTARLGMLGGMYFKRVIMLFWALAGLIAIGLYAGALDDPDQIWGLMTRELLFPGAIGLMLVGILAANMSSLDALSVTNSALFVRNLYQPLRAERSEQHYVTTGRIVIGVILLGGVIAALYAENLLTLFQYFISLPAVFGAPIWLGFVWRRLTKPAVITQVVICFTLYAIIPNLFPSLTAVRTHPTLLAETTPRQVTVVTGALQEDVDVGRATEVGETIRKPHLIEATGIYFERVVRTDPADPNSPLEGQGRFHAEIWVLSWLGIDFSRWGKAQLVATRFFFDALFPFVLLFFISAFTSPVEKPRLDRFYGKLHTPVQPTKEEDVSAVERAAVHPEDYEEAKVWRGSSWEILRPGKIDILGFGISWVLVGVVLVLLWFLATVGS